MRVNKFYAVVAVILSAVTSTVRAKPPTATPSVAVGPQYDSTHVYVALADLETFTSSLVAIFGGTKSQPTNISVTPTPSETTHEYVFTPVGLFSVFGFKTPIPYPYGGERTGYLVSDFDAAVRSAKAHDAEIIVAPFKDPIGRDVVISWPGGVHMELYWHTAAPHYPALQSVPENRLYVSPDRADAFIRDFAAFSHGKTVSDDRKAPGLEIGRPNDSYRRVRIDSLFGKTTVLVTDGHLPYPYGRELTGYDVENLSNTLTKARAAGATVLVQPYNADGRQAAMVQFPGGYIAEVHDHQRIPQ